MIRKFSTQRDRTLTLTPLDESLPATAASSRPEFLRLPKPGKLCPYTGMARSALNGLILPNADNGFRPPVKSFVLRRRGARTGIRLIDYESLVSYIRAHSDAGGVDQTEEGISASKPPE